VVGRSTEVDTNTQDLVNFVQHATPCEANARCAQAVSAGNFDNFGPDELAITWLDNDRIDVRILAKNAGDWQFTQWDVEYIDTRPATSAIRHYLHMARSGSQSTGRAGAGRPMTWTVASCSRRCTCSISTNAHQVQKVQTAWATYSQYNVWASIEYRQPDRTRVCG